MGYEFRVVDICLFDFHLAKAPLMAANAIQPAFAFLADEQSYNTKYKAGQEIVTANFRFKPLGRRMINHHRFWRHYHRIRESGGEPNYWNVQMPFIGKPTQTHIALNTNSKDFTGEVWPTIFLTAMGWSTHLKLRLRGKMTPEQLKDFMRQLGDENNPPFQLGNTLARWQGVFNFFAEQLRKEVYTPQVSENTSINRHTIISLSRYSGEIYSYQGQRKGVPLMTAGDRAALHSILLGRKVELPELIKSEGKDPESEEGEKRKQFLLTLFPKDNRSGADFAITYDKRGTLIFMQQIASEEWNRWQADPKEWRRRLDNMQCHTANMRDYLLMTLTMIQFYNDTKDAAADNATIKSLRDNIGKTLAKLPGRYTSRFCESFHTHYVSKLPSLKQLDFQLEEAQRRVGRREPR